MVGDEVGKFRYMLEVNYLMDNGIVWNWDDMKYVWDYMFGEMKLNVDIKNCKVSLNICCIWSWYWIESWIFVYFFFLKLLVC